jgi:hypothetical protein
LEILDVLGNMGCKEIINMWYKVNGVKKLLKDVTGAMKMESPVKSNGKVDLFFSVSQSNYMVHIEEQSNTHIKDFFQPVHENFFLSDDQTIDLRDH